MTDHEPAADRRPLLGPGGRIPTVEAVAVTRQGGVAALRAGWLPRHTLAMLLLAPAAFLGYRSLPGADASLTGSLVVGAMSLLAALILTTYLPLRGAGSEGGSSCALAPLLLVPMAGFLLNGPASTGGAFMALGILAVGLVQRLSGASACGSAPRP